MEKMWLRNTHHDGLTLVGYRDIAIGVYELKLNCYVRESTSIPTTDEFILRTINNGIEDAISITGFLGLSSAYIKSKLSSFLHSELIKISNSKPSGSDFKLTQKGLRVMREAPSSVTKEADLEAFFHGLLREFWVCESNDLMDPQEVQDRNLNVINPHPNTPCRLIIA